MDALRRITWIPAAALMLTAMGCGSDRDAKQARSGQTPYYESAAGERQAGEPRRGAAGQATEQAPPPVILLELEPLSPPTSGQTDQGGAAEGQAGYDWSKVDRRYRQVVQGFSSDVRLLVENDQRLEQAEHTLALLAHAVETIPAPEGRELLSSAERIRAQAEKLKESGEGKQNQAEKRRAVKQALEIAAGAMSRLAEGPYAAAPNVGEQVRELSRALEKVEESDAVWTNRGAAYAALTEASEALRAFELAIASGRVNAAPFAAPTP